jgi:hypothetical protein
MRHSDEFTDFIKQTLLVLRGRVCVTMIKNIYGIPLDVLYFSPIAKYCLGGKNSRTFRDTTEPPARDV